MKRSSKILALLLVLVMVFSMIPVISVSAAKIPGGTKLYLVPSSNWNTDNARFAAYFFGDGEAWVSMTKVAGESNLYEVTSPAGKNFTNVIFCRMNPNASANNWNNKWNQTSDLTYNGTSNCYTVKAGTWDKGGGSWSTYASVCAHKNVGAAATCTTSQNCLDCGDPVVDALGHTYNSSHLCTRCNEQAAFTVAGTGAHLGTEWDTGNTANDMTFADGTYTKVYTNVAAGSYLFKVVRDHDWGTAYPSADKAYTVSTAGSTVTITLKGTTVNVVVEAPHTHSWSDATCTEPQKCSCGETQGEALGHDFVAGVCSRCQEKDPNYVPPHEHNFVDGMCECGEYDPSITRVATLEELLAALAADNDNVIIITTQIVVPEGETVEMDLNGKTVNSVFNAGSTTNHIYALRNRGTLTINDTVGGGSLNSRGVYNHGTLTLNGGKIACIDGNGGYAMNNEEGSTFVMNGGEIAATYEDDYQSSSGGYDATPLDVPAGCIATLNGGKITNVCDFTFAIASAGTLNIPATSTLEVIGTHGAIAVSGGVTTIDAGKFIIPSDEYSRTDNVIYVYGGSIVINGGEFIGDYDTASGGSCVCDTVGTATINGGSFAGSSGGDVWGTTGTTIKGGTFENLVEKSHIAPGFELDENGTVVSKHFVAQVGDVKYETLAEALENGSEIVLLDNVKIDAPIVVTGTLVLDLNGFTLSYDSTVMGEAMITNKGTLTINDSVGTGVINYNYVGAADSSYGKGNYTISNAGTLTVNGGYITIAKLRGHAKYPIDNNSTTGDAILVINGGHLYNYNTSAIRQFCNSTTNKNSVTINGGIIEGYCAIWIQNPGKNTVNGDLTITGGEIRTTAAAWVAGTAELKDVASSIYCTIAGEGGDWSEASFVVISGGTINENVYLAENAPASLTIGEATFNGYVELPHVHVYEAVVTAPTLDAEGYTTYTCSCGDSYVADRVPALVAVATADGNPYATLAEALVNGSEIVLLSDIVLTESIVLDGESFKITLDLNGYTINAAFDAEIVEVLLVKNGATLIITGNGTMLATGDGEHVEVISAIDGGKVTIENGTFVSNGCTTIYATRGGLVTINGGLYEAKELYKGMDFTLDINEAEDVLGAIVVNGGSFVRFNPANHNNDGANSNKLADGLHALAVEGIYTVGAHNFLEGKCECGAEDPNYVPPHVHAHKAVVTAPTCTADGYTTYTCDCGDTYTSDEVAALGHDMVAGEVVAPTLDAQGYTVYGCSRCDVTENRDFVDALVAVATADGDPYATLAEALENGSKIVLLTNIELDAPIVVAKGASYTIDLNGHTLSYTSTNMGEAMITNKGTLVINDSVGTGVINYNYVGANDASYGKGNYTISNGGTLTVNGGKITIANLRSHAKYPIDNNSTTGDAILVINGGHLYNYNTAAIRMFCNSTTYKNSVTINGGLVEGYSAIWMQNPGSKTVHGALTITGGEIRTTAAAYVNGTASVKEVSSGLYTSIDGNGGAWTADSLVSITGGTLNENVNVYYEAPENVTIGAATFNGNVWFVCKHVWADATCTVPKTCSVCGETEGEALGHKDADPCDHECDVCGLCLSDCVDADNNHKCDICGDVMSKCTDNDQNHFCDVCGVQNSHCIDLPPYDHNCDWCGAKASEHNFVEGKCDVCGEEDPNYVPPHVHSWSEATCTEPSKCECGETNGEALGHNYVNGTCDVCNTKVIYFVNVEKWTKVNAYMWDSTNNGWPGVAMTKTGEQVNGFDIYKVEYTAAYVNVIFNNGSAQTADLVISKGHYFCPLNSIWYESASDVPSFEGITKTNYYLPGGFNSWKDANAFLKEGTSTTIRSYVSLAANTTYEFKVKTGSTWYGSAGTVTATSSTITFSTTGTNAKIKTACAGLYVFEYNTSTKKLTVIYPHVEETLAGKDATCTEAGLTEGKKCTICGTVTVAQKTIAALGHEIVVDAAAVAPTCTATGLTAGEHCSRCDYKVEQEVVPALGHTAGAEATCTTAQICTVCHAELVAALGHSYENCACTVCGAVLPALGQTDSFNFTTADGLSAALASGKLGYTGTFRNNGDSHQFAADSSIQFVVPANTTVTITGHSTNYGVFNVYLNGEKTVMTGALTFTVKEETKVVIATGDNGASYSYIKGILLTEYVDRTIVEDTTINFGSEGNYKDSIVDFSGIYIGDNGGNNSQVKNGSFDLLLKAGSKVVIHGYPGYTSYKLNDGEPIEDEYYTYLALEDTVLTVTPVSGNNYFYSIEVTLHTGVALVEAKDATCTEAGHGAYYACECHGELTEKAEVAALGHDIVVDEAVAPTCTATGLTAGEHCSRCDHKVEQTVVDALGHDIVVDDAVAPTCTATGLTAGEHCSRCDHKVEQTVVDALGHDIVVDEAVAPTCTATGLTAGEHCSRCDHKVEQTVVDALGHDIVVDAAVDATCTATGLTAGEHCSRCDHKVAQEEVPALGHTFVGGECSCGEKDPNAQPPVDDPTDKPTDEPSEEPAPNFLQIIIDLFAKILEFFKNLFNF